MKNGIAFAGNLVADTVKKIDVWPDQGMLTNIREIKPGVGGLVCNTCGDIAIINPEIPLYAIGLLGEDGNGEFLRSSLANLGIDVSGLKTMPGAPTSFTDVMTVIGTGERTFFHDRGTSARFGPEHIDLDNMKADILHMGYAMLLDRFDGPDPEYGTVMAHTLHDARQRGIKTSIDVVSDSSDRFPQVVIPALKYCTYIILNEVEASLVTGIPVRTADGKIDGEAIRAISAKMLDLGVEELVAIHAPEGGWCMTKDGAFCFAPSIDVPKSYIKGKVGAGDAFCAGMLYGIYMGWEPEKCLRFGSCTAIACMSEPDSISGMKDEAGCWALEAEFAK